MTWYLGITTTRLIAPRFGAEKVRGEFAVEQQLRDMGIDAHAPRKTEFLRRGKKRHAEAVTSAYLPGYIFANIPADRYFEVIREVRGLSRTLMAIPAGEEMGVKRFIGRAAAEQAEAERIVARQDKAAMREFKAGDALSIISGPFADQVVSFKRMVTNAEGWDEVEVEAELFGQTVRMTADPLDVRRAV